MKTIQAQWPNDATLLTYFGLHYRHGLSIKYIALTCGDTPEGVQAVLDDPRLREKWELMERLRKRRNRRQRDRGIEIELYHWQPSTATAKPARGPKSGKKDAG